MATKELMECLVASLTPQNIGLAHSKYRANEHKVKLAYALSSAVDIHQNNC